MSPSAPQTVRVNRAPVLTLWGSVVAEQLGYDHDTALTLGKAVAGLSAQSKGRRLGVLHEAPEEVVERRARARAKAGVKTIELMGRKIPVVRTKAGLRAVKDQTPESPEAIERYLKGKLGAALPAVRAAMVELARSLPEDELAKRAFELYESFRPGVPSGEKGWGAKGTLNLRKLRALAKE